MKTLALLFAALSLVVLTALSAHADWKHVGGGNSVGGTLLDQYEAGAQTEVDGLELYRLLGRQYGDRLLQLPELARYAARILVDPLQHKRWYLDNRKLSNDCLNQTTLDQTSIQIIACQNDVEIRSNADWWTNATDQSRALLVLHEVVTSLALQIGNLGNVRAAVAQFIAPHFDAVQTRDQMWMMKFAFIPTLAEMPALRVLTNKALSDMCPAQNESAALLIASSDADTFSTTANTNLALIASEAALQAIDDMEWKIGCQAINPVVVEQYVDLGWERVVAAKAGTSSTPQ